MTQFDASHSKERTIGEARRGPNLFRIAIFIFSATVLTIPVVIYLAWQMNAWQVYVMVGVALVHAVFQFIAIQMIRRGQTESGSWILMISQLIAMLIGVLLTTNLGIIIGLIAAILTYVIANLSLPAESARRAQIMGVAAGIFSVALDLLKLDFRLSVPALQIYLPVLTLITLVTGTVFIFRTSRGQISTSWRASIRNRLTMIVVGASIIPVLVISIFLGGVTYAQIRNELSEEAFAKLAAVQTIKSNQVSEYLVERRSDMFALRDTVASLLNESLRKMDAINALKHDQIIQLFKTWDADVRDVASDPGVVLGMQNLANGFQLLGPGSTRSLYLGQSNLNIAGDGSEYSAAHYEQHTFFTGYTAIHGYEDALLIDMTGNVVYSVHKSEVFGTNLLTGPFKESNLANLYIGLVNGTPGESSVADAALLGTSYAMFIGTPIYQGSTPIGVLVYQLPLSVIKTIIAEKSGQGITGETWMVAMETDNRITYRSDRTTVGTGEFVFGYDITSIAQPFLYDALSGNTGGDITIGTTGEAVINAYRPIEVEGLHWAIVTRVTAAEALSPTRADAEQDFLSEYKENYGFYDVFLIYPDGYIFYSVAQEAENRTNILTGEFNDSNLADLVSEINESKAYEFADFAFYEPSGGAPAAFLGIPVVNSEGDVQLIVSAQLSLSDLNDILAETTGLGETGETYLVGPDQLWRNDSRHLADLGAKTTVLNEDFKIDTVASRSALAGKSGQGLILGYRGTHNVLSVWSPLIIAEANESRPEEKNWAFIAAIDESEALAPVNQLARTLGLAIGLAVLAIGVLAVYLGTRFSLGFVTPILNLTDTATQVAGGNLDLRLATNSVDEIGTLTNTFNQMTAQLQDTLEGLEQRVANRTKALATSAEVTRRLASILDPRQLISEVVNEVRSAFDYYYTQIYLLDEAGEKLVIAGGTGEAGASMLARKHSVPTGRGLVGRAAQTNASVLVPDTYKEEGWLSNELLPETRSEAAVPISIGKQVFGVLDVQHNQVNGLTLADITLLESLAGQVAISLQNARSYEQSRKQAELESLVNTIAQRIQRTTSIEETLQTAIRELGMAVGATRVKASLRSSSSALATEPTGSAGTVKADGVRINGSSNPEGALAD